MWPKRMIFSHQNGRVRVRTQQFRLDHRGALFDMTADPGQRHDIAKENRPLAARLSAAVAAWKKDVLGASGGDDRPFPVGYKPFPVTWLPARDALPQGKILRSSRHPNCSFLTNWVRREDEITWDIAVAESGQYEAVVYYTCAKDNVGSTIELSFRGSSIRAKVARAFDPPLIDDMDRVQRSEGYAKDFRPLRLGVFRLQGGRGKLTLRALEIPGKQVMDLRAVALTLQK